jgi:aspartyl-tRNA(Asn)/glutamyl-tRNA(Gln) amidotransferase subunit C
MLVLIKYYLMTQNSAMLTIDEVRHVAQLAKLTLSDEELVKFQTQLSAILDYVRQLQAVDTTGVEETSQVTGLENVLRDDVVVENLSNEEALSNVKSKHKGYVKVPGVLENN